MRACTHTHTNARAHMHTHTQFYLQKLKPCLRINVYFYPLWNCPIHNSERISYLKEIGVKILYIQIFPKILYAKNLNICNYYYHTIIMN